MARKILLADDSVTAQNMGRKILADAGYDVITVNNGSAALKKIAELKPELIILDVYMPGYSGLEVCQRLKDAQETARIPVLLTVGKLEPFKPDEAKRVRAEGYIVKPFEASELLSALSKLEDKIVPKAEAGKPGRLNRAVAIDESSHSGDEPVADGSWKSRISFPSKKKTETAEEGPDDSALYNAVNRDLKTVVQRDAPRTPAAADVTAKPASTKKPEQELVDLGALAAAGLPKDVTTEEIAALAAAAAQVKGKKLEIESAAGKAEEEKVRTEEEKIAAVEAAPDAIAPAVPGPVVAQVATTQTTPTEDEVTAALASLEQGQEREDLPVTMAASAIAQPAESDGPRWMAVPVVADAHESAVSLEQEMQMAFKTFAAAAAAQAGPATLSEEPRAVSVAATPPEAMVASLPAVNASIDSLTDCLPSGRSAISNNEAVSDSHEFPIAPTQEITDHSEQRDYSGALEPQLSEAAATDIPPHVESGEPTSISAEATPLGITAERVEQSSSSLDQFAISPRSEMSSEEISREQTTIQEVPSEATVNTPANESEAQAHNSSTMEAAAGEAESLAAEVAPADPVQLEAAQIEAVQIEAAQAGVAEGEMAQVEIAQNTIEHSEPQCQILPAEGVLTEAAHSEVAPAQVAQSEATQPDPPQEKASELATAAAWANWRQIRDTLPEHKATRSNGDDAEVAENLVTKLTAMAVAAGAEASPTGVTEPVHSQSAVDSSTVASIVDSLLAELRPKIVEEISRKLAAERK